MNLERHPLWRKPRHHLDSEVDSDAEDVHWIELFYDLSHVVAIFILGNYLSHHLTVSGFLIFAALFSITWFAWLDISLFNSLYVSTDIHHRYIMAVQIFTIMVMSAAILHIGAGWTYFALSFAVNRMVLALLYWRTRVIGDTQSQLPTEFARNFFVMGALLVLSALVASPYNYGFFVISVVIGVIGYAHTRFGVMRYDRFVLRIGHMAERFALLILIVSGEGFFKLVVTLAEQDLNKVPNDVFANYAIGGFAIFVLCWTYFDFVGNGKTRDNSRSTIIKWVAAHLMLMLFAVMVGVALSAEVKVSFWDSYPTNYAALGCIGLAGYLYSLLVLQNVIELRTAHRFATAKVRAFGIVMAFVTLLAVPYVPSIVANVLWITALFSQIIIPVSHAYITFSRKDPQ